MQRPKQRKPSKDLTVTPAPAMHFLPPINKPLLAKQWVPPRPAAAIEASEITQLLEELPRLARRPYQTQRDDGVIDAIPKPRRISNASRRLSKSWDSHLDSSRRRRRESDDAVPEQQARRPGRIQHANTLYQSDARYQAAQTACLSLLLLQPLTQSLAIPPLINNNKPSPEPSMPTVKISSTDDGDSTGDSYKSKVAFPLDPRLVSRPQEDDGRRLPPVVVPYQQASNSINTGASRVSDITAARGIAQTPDVEAIFSRNTAPTYHAGKLSPNTHLSPSHQPVVYMSAIATSIPPAHSRIQRHGPMTASLNVASSDYSSTADFSHSELIDDAGADQQLGRLLHPKTLNQPPGLHAKHHRAGFRQPSHADVSFETKGARLEIHQHQTGDSDDNSDDGSGENGDNSDKPGSILVSGNIATGPDTSQEGGDMLPRESH